MGPNHRSEIDSGERFAFGANWTRFLRRLDDRRIAAAEESLRTWLGTSSLAGTRFLDVGSGSGLFSLAARRLGADVRSFDFDLDSVACTMELRRRFEPGSVGWTVERGSVLDPNYLAGLGRFDLVYSWGVLHHTGHMREALANVVPLVSDAGRLFIAIYNDQGWLSRYWLAVKRLYNHDPVSRGVVILFHAPYLWALRSVYRRMFVRSDLERGMDLWYDMLDWLGGLPFEVARPEEIVEFYRQRGFVLERLATCGGRHGCNEFLFRKL